LEVEPPHSGTGGFTKAREDDCSCIVGDSDGDNYQDGGQNGDTVYPTMGDTIIVNPNDHCHDSRKVRGLLCNDCNLAVGYGKTPEVLDAAARYLRDRQG
jgi:hypothetical protein